MNKTGKMEEMAHLANQYSSPLSDNPSPAKLGICSDALMAGEVRSSESNRATYTLKIASKRRRNRINLGPFLGPAAISGTPSNNGLKKTAIYAAAKLSEPTANVSGGRYLGNAKIGIQT
ncbi:MAG: hypothetical protein CBB71_10375 [Rhodopirellula sp. TMED11]|nr:MAG: hypothetical protein CBB71_10375 [Rhodopirellula sp. TMED11]